MIVNRPVTENKVGSSNAWAVEDFQRFSSLCLNLGRRQEKTLTSFSVMARGEGNVISFHAIPDSEPTIDEAVTLETNGRGRSGSISRIAGSG